MSFPQGNDKVQLRDRALEKQSSSAPSMAELRASLELAKTSMEKELKSNPSWHTTGYLDGRIAQAKDVLAELDRIAKAPAGEVREDAKPSDGRGESR